MDTPPTAPRKVRKVKPSKLRVSTRIAEERRKIDFHTCITVVESMIDVLVDTGADVTVRLEIAQSVRCVHRPCVGFGETSTEAEVFIVRQNLFYLESQQRNWASSHSMQ